MLHITTPYGNHYVVNSKGEIAKNGQSFSGGWKMIGIGRVNSNYVSNDFQALTPDLVKSLQLRYKNGNPRYTVHDLDYGTHRSWGNTRVHGIGSMWFDEVTE